MSEVLPIPELTEAQTKRFWSLVSPPKGRRGCRLWRGTINKGKGHIWAKGRNLLAVRVAYCLATGSNPSGPQGHILHRCDTPLCCEPKHLFTGSYDVNNKDRASKGRSCRGEKMWTAKLTARIVRQIRKRRARGETQRSIGESYGVTQALISYVLLGHIWRHVK